jgi:hypothetical protein
MGKVSKSYKIPRELLGQLVPIIIKDRNINKRISEQMLKNRRAKVKNLEFAKTRYFKTFKIDILGANKAIHNLALSEIKRLSLNISSPLSNEDIKDIIECKPGHEFKRLSLIINDKGKALSDILHRYMVYTTRINAINDGFLFFKRNETNGRLDTNLTSLPSFLRPYIISTENLVNVDIRNSQPYFLYTLIRRCPDIPDNELALYGDLVVNGKFYEYMVEHYKITTGYSRTRPQLKDMLYKIFFSKIESYASYKHFFGSLFPSIMSYINKTNEERHNTLAIQLQTMESSTILDVIMPLLEANNIRPYTIHDSFVCTESESLELKNLFTEKLIELYGIAPSLHMDYLVPPEIEEEELIEQWDDEFLENLNLEVDRIKFQAKKLVENF